MDDASLRDFRGDEGTYVADALERSLLLPADMAELGGLRSKEVFLDLKRYLGMVRLLTLDSMDFILGFQTNCVLISIGWLYKVLVSHKLALQLE